MRLLGVLLASLAVSAPGAALAWGDEGHEVVGLIAEHYLKADVRDEVNTLLAGDKTGLINHDTGDLIADEATWADKYRDADDRRTHYIATRDWHFVDLEVTGPDLDKAFGHPDLPEGTPASQGPAEDCIVDKIEQFKAELSDPREPPAERLMALQFILHFVGDLHQPLHASDDHDAGGNGKRVASADFGAGKLHAFWDTQFVQALGADPRAAATRLEAQITPQEAAEWAQGTPERWALEAYGASKAVAYGGLPAPDSGGVYQLNAAYETKAEATVAAQLSKAGVRLAAVLNEALDH